MFKHSLSLSYSNLASIWDAVPGKEVMPKQSALIAVVLQLSLT